MSSARKTGINERRGFAGKGVEIFLLQGIEMAFGNLGRQRDFLKRDPSQLSLAPHTLAKHAHV